MEEIQMPGLKTRNYVNLNELKQNKYYFYNGIRLGYFHERVGNDVSFSEDKYDDENDDENDENDENDINVYSIINIDTSKQLPSSALLEELEPEKEMKTEEYAEENSFGGKGRRKDIKSKKRKNKGKSKRKSRKSRK
jgi:hypothetical protein